MTKDHNPRRSDSEWTELIAECRRRGLSDDCWCKNNGIPVSTFYNAVSRLRKKARHIPAGEKQGTINLAASQDAVPISIIPPNPHSCHWCGPIQTAPRSVIGSLTGNAVIRVSNGTEPQLLSHVLHLT